MRPALLDSIFTPMTSLLGIGPKQERVYQRLLGHDRPRIIDLLFHLPTNVIDRRSRPKLCNVVPHKVVTVAVVIDHHKPPPPGRSRSPYRIYAHDSTGSLVLTYFHAYRTLLERLYPIGALRYVSG